ncbi:uncharacterized protein ATNIH1004_006623 [Aspergillus tanneri]|uniref:Cystathionine gamma-synthase n=1 Tax=Aspergillus tanneri TaxID=1220188 RepID=A0A5M9MLN9_9EURO|nr:uncharacterized protein ATNIH1004_006623 [Aspergillus tanneri]KAA8647921.1 hypothetical protein ATNIH1004_006623 [Aspergillus tanneri]
MSALPQLKALGDPIPDRDHAISVHFPTWDDVRDYGAGKPRVANALQMDIQDRTYTNITKQYVTANPIFCAPSEELVLFPDYQTAEDCKIFITSQRVHSANAANPKDVSLVLVEFNKAQDASSAEDVLFIPRLYGVVHPAEFRKVKMTFWRLTGTGISSRPSAELPVYDTIRKRVAEFLNRAPTNPGRAQRDKKRRCVLYPSGMAAIYHVHHALPKWRNSDIMMLGFPYELTIKMIEAMNSRKGQKIQSVWCECPNNPMLRTSNLKRVRKLANQYDFIFVVDDTIGSFANVDVMDVADIVVTSLSKYFNGFADVLAGSIFLNSNFPHYPELKNAFNAEYTNNLYLADAMRLELNSRGYLERFTQQNNTASAVVDFLCPYTSDAKSTLATVYYPKLVLQQEKTWASSHGLSETLVRISVGMVEKHSMLECVKKALQAADATRNA